ncbi:MAG: hypothetical protein K6F77_05835 [Lachnospiraceae bacterium]|nr:hypothetical protein [Lachnospiraceae bacterium]
MLDDGYSKLYYQICGDSISVNSYRIWNLYDFVSKDVNTLEIFNNLTHVIYFADKNDTCATWFEKPFNNGKYFTPTFSEQMTEMKACLYKASSDFDISKLRHITCFLISFDTVACDVSSRILSSKKNFKLSPDIVTYQQLYDVLDSVGVDCTHKAIDKELAKTCLKDSLNSVLECFNLQVDTIMSQEEVSFRNKSGDFLRNRSSLYRKKETLPFILDTELYIKLKSR